MPQVMPRVFFLTRYKLGSAMFVRKERRTEMGHPVKRRLILCLLPMLLVFIPLNLWSAQTQYVDTPKKDFNADAPWRVETADTPIPFSILIKDVWKDDLKALIWIDIVTLAYPGPEEIDRIYSQLGWTRIRCARPENPTSDTEGCINGNWELNIYKFRGTGDAVLDGKPITPARLGYRTGDDIYFKARIRGKDENLEFTAFTKYLKVHVGEPLPKPAEDWFYGDTHFHTEYTNDLKEYGGQLTAVRDAAKAMGLDFVTTTDHASDLADDLRWEGWFGCWDLCPEAWNDRKERINDLNDGNGLPFITGEEITCQTVDGDPDEGGIHLLVYNNDAFISGKINYLNLPQYSLKSRLDELNASALAYAAHPMDKFDLGPIHQIAEWSDQNYNTALDDPLFKGLEIWNTRKTKTNCIDTVCPKLDLDFYINPFDENGQWPLDVANWDEGLVDGIKKWDALLRASLELEPLRKIFISGGSDAHGDMNYTIGGIGPSVTLDDNAMGKVRTLVHAPKGKDREYILDGFRNGRSVVTDGPVVIFGIDRNNDGELEGNSRDIIIGDDAVVPLSEDARFLIQWNSTSEFGSIDEIAIFEGTNLQTLETVILTPNNLEGRSTWIQRPPSIPAMYYYRIEARIKDDFGNIVYRCLSNPIWINWADSACINNDVPEGHWYGMYFDNINLNGDPVMVRDDGGGFLNFDWAYDSPGSDCGIGTDYFSARWLKRVFFDSGTYRFTITSDDGFKLYIDGEEKLSEWKIQGPTTYNVDVELSEGFHWVIMEYYENNGYATAKLSWEELSPTDCIETVSLQRWKGEYFGNKDLSGSPLMVRDDGSGFLNFDWAYDGPGSDCGIQADNFSARWLRIVYFSGGTYRFTITSDDGFKLYIDGEEKLSKWIIQGPTTYTVDVPLSGGDHVIKLEYYENGGYATAKLSWEELSQADCLESVTPQRWKGEYFGNKDLSGSPLMVRDDGSGFLNFDWAYDGPGSDCGIQADNFSARWTRNVDFNAGTYRFTITSDDGFRLYIDGVLKLSKWIIQGPTTYTVNIPLSGGDHVIKLEYYENGGYATAKLSWEQLSQADCIETVFLQHWKGEYFGNKDLSGSPLMVRDDGSGFLDFDWGLGAPIGDCGIPADNFSARWIRIVNFNAGTYRFKVTSDDGFRLYIDNALKLDKWFDQGATTYTVDVPLSGGDHDIKLEYYENGGYATAKLSWEELSPTDCIQTVSLQRWKGEYFGNKDLSGSPLMVRDDGSGFLDFDWGLGAPTSDCGIPADNFSARWLRNVYFSGGTYRFTVTSDDGFRLYIDNALKLDKWFDQGATIYTVDVSLSGGDHVISLEYYENGGYAVAKLVWEEVSPTGGWAFPVGSADSGAGWVVTNPLGNSWYSSQNQRWYRGHLGEDWFKSSGSSLGEPVYAASAGKVITVLNNCGNYVDVVIIEHQVEGFAEPIYSFYGHIEADGYVQKGDLVKTRQQIGRLGDPITFEPHLHFEIKNRTALINPPFSNCSNIPNGVYISAGYSGISDDYNGGAYYDPSDDISGNRYYHPTRFIEDRKDIPPETDCSKFVADLNYPDGTVVAPGQTINKGWRLSNCGDTIWSTDGNYRAVKVSGSYGPASFNIPTVGPELPRRES
jgi:murein DD-endopeptidase MepM/ murein hydrolase activator NlpD